MKIIRNKFKVGDLVMDNDSGITGIVTEVSVREPAVREQWWAMSDKGEATVTILYKVKLFREVLKETHYQEFMLTLLSTGEE